jgi:hypothetical protein
MKSKSDWASPYMYGKYSGRYFGFSLLIVFVLAPLVGWMDYQFALWHDGGCFPTVTEWDTYTFFFMGCLVIGGFGGIISYVFRSDSIAGKADGYFSLGVIVASLVFTITDFWFWVLRGLHQRLPLTEWFPGEGYFPAILPWRFFGISMSTELHLFLVVVGFAVIFGGTHLFCKKYL